MSDIEDRLTRIAIKIKEEVGLNDTIVDKVHAAIIRLFNEKNYFDLTLKDIESMDIIREQKKSSPKDINIRNCVNYFLYEFSKPHNKKIPLIETPLQVKRHLIVYASRHSRITEANILELSADLLRLSDSALDDIKETEYEYICRFMAAAAIFSQVIFQGFNNKLLLLRWRDIALSPCYIKIYNNDNAYYRYYLQPPASVHLFLCLLLYISKRQALGITAEITEDAYVFLPMLSRKEACDIMRQRFRKWLGDRLNQSYVRLEDFGDTVLFHSIITRDIINDYFPFVIAAQAGRIQSSSFTDASLAQLFGRMPIIVPEVAQVGSPQKAKKDMGYDNNLADAMSDIVREVTGLGKRANLKQMRSKIVPIDRILASAKDKIGPESLGNLQLFGKYTKDMLKTRIYRLQPGSIKANCSEIKSFVHNLSALGSIADLEKDKIESAIAVSISGFGPSKKDKIKKFINFLKTEVEGVWSDINMRYIKPAPKDESEELEKTTMLIDFTHISAALQVCRNRQQESQKAKSAHDLEIIYHMICLGFYVGLRAVEFTHLEISGVIFDRGEVLCIRFSKTDNGIRNIPLHLLLPDSYLREFKDYLGKMRRADNKAPYLFPTYEGTLWKESALSNKLAAIFKSIGIDMHFHLLRHMFANWFLLRWFVAFHKGKVPGDAPFLQYELFQEEYLSNIRTLMLGYSQGRTGQQSFTHAIAVLARLMGHGGPVVTMESYLHNIDWLFYMLTDRTGACEVEEAAALLHVRPAALPECLRQKDNQKATVRLDVLEGQLSDTIRSKLRFLQ